MKTYYVLFVFLILFISKVQAQDNRYFVLCPIDTTTEFELTLVVSESPTTFELTEKLSVERILRAPHYWMADSCKKPYSLSYNEAEKKINIQTNVLDTFWRDEHHEWHGIFHDSIVQVLNLSKIRKFNLLYFSTYHWDSIHQNSPFDLSSLQSLKHLQLNNLESFDIDVEYHSSPVWIHLSEWPNYETLKNSGTIRNISIQVNSFKKEDLLQDLQQIKGIEKAKFYQSNYDMKRKGNPNRQLTIDDYMEFPDLISISNYEQAFSHRLVNMKHFMGFEQELFKYVINDAESYFFSECLPGNGFFYINYIDTLLYQKIPETMKGSGMIAVQAKDLFDWPDVPSEHGNFPSQPSLNLEQLNIEDTIAIGRIDNGVQVGEWRYFGYLNAHNPYCSYDHRPVMNVHFPENGEWVFNYPNGNVAIQGQFKNGKKTGIWRFYSEQGEFQELETYELDRLHGYCYTAAGVFYEKYVQKFYMDKKRYSFVLLGDKPEESIYYVAKFDKNVINTNSRHDLSKTRKNGQVKLIEFNSNEYRRITKRLRRRIERHETN